MPCHPDRVRRATSRSIYKIVVCLDDGRLLGGDYWQKETADAIEQFAKLAFPTAQIVRNVGTV